MSPHPTKLPPPASPATGRSRTTVPAVRRSPMFWAGLLVLGIGMGLPHGTTADAVAAAGGATDLASGFLLLRAALVAMGLLLIAAVRFDIGTHSIGVLRAGGAVAQPVTARELLAVGGMILAGAALRLPGLNADLWLDEMLTMVDYVRPPLITLLTSFESQNNHPLYSLLAKLCVFVFGESAAVFRVPAVAFGLGSIGALWWFGRQVAGRREALLATGLLTASYHHVWFSQNARAYTALLFFSLIGTTLFLRLCRERSEGARRDAVAYALVMTLAVYSHLTAAFVVVGHAAVWLVAVVATGRGRDAWRSAALFGVALAGALSLTLYAPGLGHIAAGLDGGGEQVDIVWKNPLWMLTETVRGLSRGIPGGIPVLALAATAPVTGLISLAARDRVVAALMVVPPVLTAAIMLATGHNLWPRFFFFAAGFAVLILMHGLFTVAALQRVVPARVAATAAALLLIAGSLATVPGAWGEKQDFGGALRYVESRRSAQDAVAVTGVADWVYHDYHATDWTTVEDEEALRRLTSASPRTWLVFTMPELVAARAPGLWDIINSEFEQVASFPGTLAGGTVFITVTR